MAPQTSHPPQPTERRFLSRFNRLRRRLALAGVTAMMIAPALAQTPAVGAQAPDFTLSTPVGAAVTLSSQTAAGDTVLVVLRGFPGYQCPYCVKQVHDFVDHAPEFSARKTSVLLVYPGPVANLDQHAKEFLAQQSELPANIKLVIDPDFKVTRLYGLRWDAPNETAYPATFILTGGGKIAFEKISHSHGDRTTAQDVLAQLPRR